MKSRDGKAISECGATGAVTEDAAGSRSWAGATGVCGVVLVPCRGAVHGAEGPAKTSLPSSKIVDSLAAPGLRPSHRMRDSEPLTRATSVVLLSVYVAVQLIDPAAS